jgi:hypothetical protein
MTPSGIEPATFRFVAQHLNHCATAVPFKKKYSYIAKKHLIYDKDLRLILRRDIIAIYGELSEMQITVCEQNVFFYVKGGGI